MRESHGDAAHSSVCLHLSLRHGMTDYFEPFLYDMTHHTYQSEGRGHLIQK